MAVTGGYQPGTYQASDLNRLQQVFGSAGIARGMQVVPTTPAGLSVLVTVDGTQGDGVCYLPNGGWVRIDGQLTLSVPSNNSGVTRNDAVVAAMDPTGVSGAPSVQYITNWAGGFTGATSNQLVLALVAVGTGAVSIASGNITQATAAASFGNANTAGVANFVAPIQSSSAGLVPQVQTSTAGVGLGVIDNPAASFTEVAAVAISGTARGLALVWVDAAGVQHTGYQVNGGGALIPTNTSFGGAVNAPTVSAPTVGATTVNAQTVNVTTVNAATIYGTTLSGTLHGNVVADAGGSIFLKTSTVGMRLYAASTTTGITFQKYDFFALLPFN